MRRPAPAREPGGSLSPVRLHLLQKVHIFCLYTRRFPGYNKHGLSYGQTKEVFHYVGLHT